MTDTKPTAEVSVEERNKRINLLMGDLWDIYTDNDPEASTKNNRVWDKLVKFEAEILHSHTTALKGRVVKELQTLFNEAEDREDRVEITDIIKAITNIT